MKRKPLQQLSLASVLRELAAIPEEAFRLLQMEVQGPKAFDTDRLRLPSVANATGIDEETIALLFSALNFLYSEIHSGNGSSDIPPEMIRDLLVNIEANEIAGSDAFSEYERSILIRRLPILLRKQQSTERFRKSERLRAGFLPAAVSFASFVDLRPLLSEDQDAVEELIPLIQFRIRTDSMRQDLRNIVFQMDTSSLKLLKEAIDNAEKKLSSVSNSDWLKHLIVTN